VVGNGGCLEVPFSVAFQQVETFGWGGRGLSFDAGELFEALRARWPQPDRAGARG